MPVPNPVSQEEASHKDKADANTAASASTPADEKLSLSDQIIQDVLEPLRTGMETQNIRQILSVFDKKDMPDYSDLEGQIHAFFRQFQQVRFRYQLLQAATDKNLDTHEPPIESYLASATAEMDMDPMPYSVTQIPRRRSVQMRFQLKQVGTAWKIVGFSPADFFNVDYTAK